MNNVTTLGGWDWSRVVRVPFAPADVNALLLSPGDVLFNNTNSTEQVGKSALFRGFPEPITFSNHFTRIRTTGDLEPEYLAWWLTARWHDGTFARLCDRWVGQSAIRVDRLLELLIPLPDPDEQHRITRRLAEQLAMAQEVRKLVDSRRGSAALAVARLVSETTSRAFGHRPSVSLKDVIHVVGSTSTFSDGDAQVLTVTSGCLTPAGFMSGGLRQNRMRHQDVDRASLTPGEILVSRSNTEDLVGRTAQYSGAPPGVVATDLVFRVTVDESKADGAYVSAILAGLQLQGYWKQRSSGASSTMKKITKAQLGEVVIPLPPLVRQCQIAESLGRQLEVAGRALRSLSAEAEAARALSKAILISEFGAS